MKKKSVFSAVLTLAAMTLFGCGGGGGGGGTTTPVTGTTITGVAAKGPINGGTVKVFAIKSGAIDTSTILGTGTTASDGSFTVVIPTDKTPAGPVVVEVSGGAFTDEASSAAGVPLKTSLRAAVSSVVDGDKIAITPLTHLAVKQVEGIGTFSQQEIDDANAQVGRFFQVADIIRSQPFDSTKDAPTSATDDQKKYAGALGVFSQLCNNRKGANKLEDALAGILDDLGKELNDNGGFVGTTLDDFNKAIDDFNASGKNKGGSTLTKIVFDGGVLQLQTTGSLPANTQIQSVDITIKVPAGVTINLNPASTTGEVADGVVVASSKGAVGTNLVTAKFDESDPLNRTLHIIMVNIPGMDVGEFAHVEFGLTSGTSLPAKADFVVTVNPNPGSGIIGGSTVDQAASPVDLASTVSVSAKSVAGL